MSTVYIVRQCHVLDVDGGWSCALCVCEQSSQVIQCSAILNFTNSMFSTTVRLFLAYLCSCSLIHYIEHVEYQFLKIFFFKI